MVDRFVDRVYVEDVEWVRAFSERSWWAEERGFCASAGGGEEF